MRYTMFYSNVAVLSVNTFSGGKRRDSFTILQSFRKPLCIVDFILVTYGTLEKNMFLNFY